MSKDKKKSKTMVTFKNVKLGYVYAARQNKKGGYGVRVMIPNDDEKQLKAARRAIKAAAIAKFGSDVKLGRMKTPLRDANEEEFDEDFMKDIMFFNANGDKKPGIVNRFNKTASEKDIEELCYSGAIFHVTVNFYGFDAVDEETGQKSKGVAAGLGNIMLRSAGERIGGGTVATDDFANYADESDDDDMDDFGDDDEDDWG